LNAVTSLLIERGVKADFAITPRLTARMKRHVLQNILTTMLGHAIVSDTDGHILLTAAPVGDNASIVVTFQGYATPELHEAALRAAQEAAALQGAKIDVVVRPDGGSTLSLRVRGRVAPP
jgi:hypothetical protein